MSSQHIRFRTCHQLDTALFLPELQRCSSHFNRLPTSHFNRLHFTALAITSFHGSHINELDITSQFSCQPSIGVVIIYISLLCRRINRPALAFPHSRVFDRTAFGIFTKPTLAIHFQAVAKSQIAPSHEVLDVCISYLPS